MNSSVLHQVLSTNDTLTASRLLYPMCELLDYEIIWDYYQISEIAEPIKFLISLVSIVWVWIT